MTNGIELFKNFQPLADTDYDKLLKSIVSRGNKLVQDVKLACLNAAYLSIVAGRPQPAERLLNAVPKYLKRDVETFLINAGKLAYEGTGRDKHLVYKDKAEVVIGEKKLEVPKQEEKEKAVEYVKSLPLDFKRNPVKRGPKQSIDYHAELKKALNRLEKVSNSMMELRNAGNAVDEKHRDLLDQVLNTFHHYESEVMGIFAGEEEEEETEEQRKIRELEEKLAKYEAGQADLEGKDNAVELHDQEGRAPMQAAG